MRKLTLAILLIGCNDPVHLGRVGTYEQVLTNDMDLLFMVDDSSSMTPVQQNLAQNFPVFINVLQQLPGGLPNIHIAVTTSSMGAGAFTASVPGCMSPDSGNFVYQARASIDPACQTSRLDDGAHFIIANQDGSANNFMGDLPTVFGCIAQVGANGCGFEHQLAAVETALGPNAPAGNAGFLRDYAFLGIVLITNEDDCSAPSDSQLFDPSQNSNSDPLGPLSSFRCTEFGILCGGQPPPRTPAGPLASCVSNDARAQTDPMHSLVPIQHFIDTFRQLKPSAERIRVSAIAAPADPFSVEIDPQEGFAALAHSCMSSTGTFGDPAVRIKQLVDSFGANGGMTSICQDSYSDAISLIASGLASMARRQCLGAPLVHANDPTQAITVANGQPVDPAQIQCAVKLVEGAGTPAQRETTDVPACGNGTGLCWRVFGDDGCPTAHARVALCASGNCSDGVALPSGQAALIRCNALLPQ
jgi:hypothetical protein